MVPPMGTSMKGPSTDTPAVFDGVELSQLVSPLYMAVTRATRGQGIVGVICHASLSVPVRRKGPHAYKNRRRRRSKEHADPESKKLTVPVGVAPPGDCTKAMKYM